MSQSSKAGFFVGVRRSHHGFFFFFSSSSSYTTRPSCDSSLAR
ncbi:predicted protein [Plenodomus lingam JN3]|uniref:Predicted protein n=1 Tax=Leptosphaeria maculans (strain JN3 / isolate v23.1.3 / race Av1-4-5-6-7-8) TaxID=985895 RepID=E4ZRJ2_LEPMJ|nr:predicted protein [Plenodomus lingam JN3]CBX93839.1 predicted protein [Plenodomus lingam JN3]